MSAVTLGEGKGGSLSINAFTGVQLIGLSVDGKSASGLYAQTLGTGDAGNLTITTEQWLVSDVAQVDTGTLGAGNAGNLTVNNNTPEAIRPSRPLDRQLVEAQGWVVNEKGQIVLTASSPTVTPQGEWLDSAKCNTLQPAREPHS